MAGPGIRYYHLARVLARHVHTTLAIPNQGESAHVGDGLPFTLVGYRRRRWETLSAQVAQADVCLLPTSVAGEMSQLAGGRTCLVVDGYNPLMAEWLATSTATPPLQRRGEWYVHLAALAEQYQAGDFYICASERQRDWWLGQLEAAGRINPATFDADPSLRSLVDVTAYGLSDQPLPPPKPVIKGIWPGITADDRLALWGGGLWPWLDPLTAIRAVALVRERHPRLKLVFPGTRHPNQTLSAMPTQVAAAQALAAELGLLDNGVHFGDWAPYADWPHILQECDVALTLHFDTVETRLAFRSRVLEYIWAGLPTVAAAGDATSDLIAHYGLGVVTPLEDVAAVAAAIDQLLSEPHGARDAAFAVARQALSWERAAEPLVRFCCAPRRAPDRLWEPESATWTTPARNQHVALQAERDYWRDLAQGYAAGRIMRTLNWAGRTRRRLFGG